MASTGSWRFGWHPRLVCSLLGAAVALACAFPAWAQPRPDVPDVDTVLRRVSERISRWYSRAQTVVSRETVTIQPLGLNLGPSGVPRRVVYDLRVGWNPLEMASNGGEAASVLREVLSVNGRAPRPNDELGCLDPKPVSPEPLAMLLPERLSESAFSYAGRGRTDGRPVIMLDYKGKPGQPDAVTWTDTCMNVSSPGRLKGRVWIDAETHDILRVDDRVDGRFELTVPRELIRTWRTSSVVIEQAQSSIRYKAIQFRDPEETLLLPTSIETMTVIRGQGVQRVRVTQNLTNHRRFLTGGRIVD